MQETVETVNLQFITLPIVKTMGLSLESVSLFPSKIN